MKLTTEHIFPYALNGTYVFKEASCKACAALINKQIEQVVLRTTFRTVRAALKTFSRSGEHPTTFTGYKNIVDGDFAAAERVQVPVEDWPYLVIPYQPYTPPILEGLTKGPDQYNPDMVSLKLPGAEKFNDGKGFQMAFVGGALERMLAKIAHAFAVAHNYNFGFCDLLPNVILTSKGFSAVVGKSYMKLADFQHLTHDQEAFNKICFERQVVGFQEFLSAHVQLFSPYNFPPFHVVVGRRSLDDKRHEEIVLGVRGLADWLGNKSADNQQLAARQDADVAMRAYDRAYKMARCNGELTDADSCAQLSDEGAQLCIEGCLLEAGNRLVTSINEILLLYPESFQVKNRTKPNPL